MLTIVTGYVPIQGHPRSAKEYGELGEDLFGKLRGDFSIMPFYETVQETWLCKLIQKTGIDVTHSVGDNPEKNSLAYHCVQHQKFAWLLKAAISDPRPGTLVWVDYGIGHVPGVTADVVNAFMSSVKLDDFAIPGCWPRTTMIINDYFPCWRFCGGLMVVPRAKVHKFFKLMKNETARHIAKTRNVTWEVNSLAAAEPNLPSIRWYKADHNETMFTHYGDPSCPPASSPVSAVPSDAMFTPTS